MYLMEIIGMQCEFFNVPLPLQFISSSAGRGVQFFLTHWDCLFFFNIFFFFSFSFQSLFFFQRPKTKSKNALNLDEACCIQKLLRICFVFLFFDFHCIDT